MLFDTEFPALQIYTKLFGNTKRFLKKTPVLPSTLIFSGGSPSASGETPKGRKERGESASAKPPSSNKFDTNMLNQIISGLPSTSEGKKRGIELSKVLTRANVEEVVKANADALAPHLPTTSDPQEIVHTVGAPQFQQAADFFGVALKSGELGGALRHFNLNQNVIKAADKGGLFCAYSPSIVTEYEFQSCCISAKS